MDDYRAPTPATLRGARVLTTDEAHALWEKRQAAFVDVLPQPPRPPRAARLDDLATRNRGSTFPAASGCLIPATARLLRSWRRISSKGWRRHRRAIVDRMLVFYCLRELLDVLERRETGSDAGLPARRLVSRGHRRLGSAWPADGGARARDHGPCVS